MNPNFVLIFLCLGLGILLRRTQKFPEKSPQAFNAFVIWISLPSLILVQIPKLFKTTPLSMEILIPLSMAWILLILSFVVFYSLGKYFRWPPTVTGALVLTAGLGNTSFVGLPILESFFGPESMRIGVLVDQPGTFLALSTLGLFIAALFSPQAGREFEIKEAILNILRFPPFIALIVAGLWFVSGIDQPAELVTVLERLSSTLVPLALVAVGFQLRVSRAVLHRQWKPLLCGLSFKLFFAPLFFIFLYAFIFSSHSFITRVTILESAMAPMITASVVAEEFGLNSELASLMVGIGIPLSLLSVYLWNQLPLLQSMM